VEYLEGTQPMDLSAQLFGRDQGAQMIVNDTKLYQEARKNT
jgi:hypothetical protein